MAGPKMPDMEVPIEPEAGGPVSAEQVEMEGGPVEEEDGYQIVLKIRPGRITVCKKPLDPEPADGALPEYEEVEVDNMEQALKAGFKMYKDNPLDNSEDAHMDAAFNAGKPAPEPKGAY